MGADCGTAIIDGVALGFANAVQRGPVGIVGASGHRHPGGELPARRRRRRRLARDRRRRARPVSAEVGGLMMRARPRAAGRRRGHARDRRDLQAAGPGRGRRDRGGRGGRPASRSCSASASTLEEAARGARRSRRAARCPALDERLADRPRRGAVRGLYSGGTLCGEAARIVGRGEFTDFGDDEYTEGRAHPMIDPSLRLEHLAAQRATRSRRAAARRGARLRRPPRSGGRAGAGDRGASTRHVIVALCGADGDPQGLDGQRERLGGPARS